MEISIYNKHQDILVQTVNVHKSVDNPLNTYLFFCPYCYNQINQIQGIVVKIQPGLSPTNDVVIVDKCSRCGMRFNMQNSQRNNKITEVILTKYKNPEKTFRCYISRTPLVNMEGEEIYLLPVNKRVQLPIIIKCPNINCSAQYHITDIV